MSDQIFSVPALSRRRVLTLLGATAVGTVVSTAAGIKLSAPAFAAGGRNGIDYAWTHPSSVGSITAAGYTFVCRYFSNDASKDLSPAEAQALIAGGLDIVSNWEGVTNAALNGYSQGVTDATTAISEATSCGMPSNRPIYFSVDFDAQPSDQTALNAYFDGVASVIGRSRTGAYAGYGPIGRLFSAGKITWGWQANAWSNGNWDARAQLRQVQNGITVGGADCDKDQSTVTDFGQWGTPSSPGGSASGATWDRTWTSGTWAGSATNMDTNPAVTKVVSTATSDGTLHVFMLIPGSGVWDRTRSAAGTWAANSNHVDTNGSVADIAALSTSNGTVHLFMVIPGSGTWDRVYSGGTWAANSTHMDTNPNTTAVAASCATDGTLHAMMMIPGSGVWDRTYSGGAWAANSTHVDTNGNLANIGAAPLPNGTVHLQTIAIV